MRVALHTAFSALLLTLSSSAPGTCGVCALMGMLHSVTASRHVWPFSEGCRLRREDTLEALFREAGFSQVSIERDRERGAVERQQDISTFGNQKIVLIYTATK